MIVFISENKKGKFAIHAGVPVESPGDNDSVINVAATLGQKFTSLVDAQSYVKNNPQDFQMEGLQKVYLEPVKTSSMGFWLNEIVAKNQTA